MPLREDSGLQVLPQKQKRSAGHDTVRSAEKKREGRGGEGRGGWRQGTTLRRAGIPLC